MKAICVFLLIVIGLPNAVFAQSVSAPASPVEWKRLQLTQEFWAEGACAGDVNRDGHMDVLSGPFWYQGPDFQVRNEIYPATAEFKRRNSDGTEQMIRGFRGFLSGENGYSDNFLSFAADLNGDDWVDYIVVGHPGKETFCYENPKGQAGPWTRRLALESTDNESPSFVDVTGDGKPELVCMSNGTLGFAQPNPNRPEKKWNWYAVARNERWQWNTHGLGYGDVNGDGRLDLLTAHNWWEQPASVGRGQLWKQHDVIFNNGGSQMFAYDVNGDGLNDVITAYEGHGYGVFWYEQLRPPKGWKKHVIVGRTAAEGQTGVVFSQPHALDLADINGDGLKDIITGKRFWAHGPDGDEEPNAPAVIYWFELKRENGQARFIAHLIDADSGVGTQVSAVDLNGDGKQDVVVGNKKGLFVHIQH